MWTFFFGIKGRAFFLVAILCAGRCCSTSQRVDSWSSERWRSWLALSAFRLAADAAKARFPILRRFRGTCGTCGTRTDRFGRKSIRKRNASGSIHLKFDAANWWRTLINLPADRIGPWRKFRSELTDGTKNAHAIRFRQSGLCGAAGSSWPLN